MIPVVDSTESCACYGAMGGDEMKVRGITFEAVKETALKNPEVRAAYEEETGFGEKGKKRGI